METKVLVEAPSDVGPIIVVVEVVTTTQHTVPTIDDDEVQIVR